jgi:hypothetical protein
VAEPPTHRIANELLPEERGKRQCDGLLGSEGSAQQLAKLESIKNKTENIAEAKRKLRNKYDNIERKIKLRRFQSYL